MNTASRILVIQTGKLGDMICTTPVFRAIKKTYPESFLTVVGDSLNKQILQGNPYVDGYLELKNIESYKTIKSLEIDVAILLNPNPSVLTKLILSRIKKIFVPKIVNGYSPYQTKIYRLLSIFVTKVEHRMGHYAPQEYLNSLVPLGITSADISKDLFVDNKVMGRVEEKLKAYKGGLRVAIAPTAGNKIKEWPSNNFGELANYLVKKHKAFIIIIGGPKDIDIGKKIEEVLPVDSVLNTVGTSIEELKAFIKQVDLFVSADTGPIYIAEAFGVPTVDIVGPVDEREQPPIGGSHLVVVPPQRLKPELYVMNARVYNYKEALRLAQSTRLEDVLVAVEQLINHSQQHESK